MELSVDAPAAREDHTWTADGDGHMAYLFGGRDGATAFGDLWAYDLDSDEWAQIDVGPGPEARFGHEAAWVDGVGLVVFGGQAGSAFFSDLWAFWPPDSTWRQLPASGDAPVARYGTCAAVGPDGRLWISHGFTADGSRFADTRAYDFGAETWTDETPDGAAPIERCLHGCWWTDDGALALYAGQTTGVTALGDRWLLSGGAWTEVEGTLPPERNLYARARLDGATLVFGGQALDGGYLADMWLLVDGEADALPIAPAGPVPPGRAGAEMIHDAAHGRVLLFGGRDGDGARNDMWELAGGVATDG
ncbi:MAG TPA: kelch repeat-containing protein [Candidatus Limnocylindria bacterium]|nr:kelch repeat-containing protein [Candidatus Limnocylindria bacterium]